jgi:hypothetical protein
MKMAELQAGLGFGIKKLHLLGVDRGPAGQGGLGEGRVVRVARAREVSRERRLAVHRVDVECEDGLAISRFTGTAYLTRQHHR